MRLRSSYGASPEVTLERLVDNIDHVCQLAGNARHVGIGSDLDGGYGREQTPADLLAARKYPDAGIAAIMHGNWLRFVSEVLPA